MTDPEITALAERLDRLIDALANAEELSAEQYATANGLAEAVTALRRQSAEIEALRGALKQIKRMLTIPAAEYVPAIPDAWAVIDAALTPKEPNNGH